MGTSSSSHSSTSSSASAGASSSAVETRVAVIGIIVESEAATAPLNAILHEFGSYIVGRMGIPYREKGISVISVVVDAPQDVISSLAGRIGNLFGVSAKTAYSNFISRDSAKSLSEA